jgi:hypothetical protein
MASKEEKNYNNKMTRIGLNLGTGPGLIAELNSETAEKYYEDLISQAQTEIKQLMLIIQITEETLKKIRE